MEPLSLEELEQFTTHCVRVVSETRPVVLERVGLKDKDTLFIGLMQLGTGERTALTVAVSDVIVWNRARTSDRFSDPTGGAAERP